MIRPYIYRFVTLKDGKDITSYKLFSLQSLLKPQTSDV